MTNDELEYDDEGQPLFGLFCAMVVTAIAVGFVLACC